MGAIYGGPDVQRVSLRAACLITASRPNATQRHFTDLATAGSVDDDR
jgi:hypothetical protein